MFLPIGTDRPLRRPTRIVYGLIAANVLVFLVGQVWSSPRADPEGWARIFQTLWLDPVRFQWWGLLGYQFLHADIWHIGFNMLFLFVFGPNVEDRFGRTGFLGFYLAAGAIAGGAHALLEVSPVIGASGAVSGVTGAYLVLFPKTYVRLFVIFFLIGSFQIPAAWFIGFAIARDIFMAFGSDGYGVAFFAHLGGYLFGGSISMFLLATKLLAREPYDLFSLGRQAHRRRQFRELTSRGGTPWSAELDGTSKVRKQKDAPEPEADPELLEGRARLNRHLAAGEGDRAAALYLELLEKHGSVTLSRDAQCAIAAKLLEMGNHADAAAAFEVFLKRWPRDRERDHMRVLLALVSARYLNDPVRASQLLGEVQIDALPEAEQTLARELKEELG